MLLTDCLADLMGGAERQIYELAKGLDKDKFNVTVASLECVGQAPRHLIEEIGCRFVDFRVKRIYGLSGFIQGIRFWRFLRRENIHLLQTYHFSSDIWGTFLAHLAGVRSIISNRRDMGFWRKRHHTWAYRLVSRWVRKVIVNTKAIKDAVIEMDRIPEYKIEVIHNGVELIDAKQGPRDMSLKSQTLTRESLGINDKDLVIMHVANISPVKGHNYLFSALRKISLTHPDFKLVVVGEDEMEGAPLRMVQEAGIQDKVMFLGKRKDVRQLLRLADICILPSLSEGMSNAILEYMAAGKPVVATNVGGNPELIKNGFNGFLVARENAEELKDALLALIKDAGKRQAMGINGFMRVTQEFSMENMVRKYEELFCKKFYETVRNHDMKILHFISSGGLFGAEQVILSLGRYARQNGIEVVIGAIHDRRDPHLEIIEKARREALATVVFKSRGLLDIHTIRELRNFLKSAGIDVLHTHNYKSDFLGLIAARMAKIPVVATAHGFTDMTRAVTFYEKLDRWLLFSFFDRVVVVTSEIFPRWQGERKKVIANGIDIHQFTATNVDRAQIRARCGMDPEDFVIATVGRLSKEKNQTLLIKAFMPLARQNSRNKLLIIGDGPQRQNLERLVTQLELTGQVIFTGLITETAAMYCAMDIFALSSLAEGVPITLLEAMASKVAVVATRVGGIPNIIRNTETGLLVASQDADGLTQALNSLMADKSKRQMLTAAAFDFVRANYSLERMGQAYQEVYAEVLH